MAFLNKQIIFNQNNQLNIFSPNTLSENYLSETVKKETGNQNFSFDLFEVRSRESKTFNEIKHYHYVIK